MVLILKVEIMEGTHMKDINEILLNPIRMRIIQELATRQSVTAAELCEKISDVPRTTLYRHINILLENDILVVISEKKVRGSLERTLALNTEEISKHNTIENGSKNAFGFLMNKYANFKNYFDGENPNPTKDKIFLNNFVLMLKDDEFDQFLSEMRELVLKYYNFEVTDERRVRDISIISTPAQENIVEKKGK